MQNWVVQGKRVFVGLEDAKRTWKLCVHCEGMIVDETSMPAAYDNLRTYLHKRYPECEIQVMYEAGFAGFWLYDRLVEDGIGCIVTPPHTVTQRKVNKVKTDKIDARRLAKTLEAGDYQACCVPDRELREDRQISRTVTQMQRNIVAVKNRIRRFLDFHGLNGDLPAGKWSQSAYASLKVLTLSRPLQVSLNALLRLLDELEAIKAELVAELGGLCEKERYRRHVEIKQSCPGVGWLSAIRFTLEWGNLTRFGSDKQMASFTGLTCRENSSGEEIHRGHITRQGNGQVRAWLIQCAWRAIRLDPALLTKYRSVWGNSGSKKKAIVAVARKLAVRMRALELAQQSYVIGVVR
jgi:transposase